MEQSLGERADGKWSAFEVGLVVPRQNGKGSVLEARALAGLFLFDEKFLAWTAHEFKTAVVGFTRCVQLLDQNSELRKKVRRIRTSHGDEGIELTTGQQLRFMARTGGSGRGFTGDTLIYDEAMVLKPESIAATLPTLSSRPNPQVWFAGSAGLADSEVLRSLRERGSRGDDTSLAYFEWSADPKNYDLDSVESAAEANPALGRRITAEFVQRERAAMAGLPDLFARERFGIWSDDVDPDRVISDRAWLALADPDSVPVGTVDFAVDSTPDQRFTAIAVGGWRADGARHVEVVEHAEGMTWAVDRLTELCQKWDYGTVMVDPASPAGSLIPLLRSAGVRVTEIVGREVGQACAAVFTAAVDVEAGQRLRHIPSAAVSSALAGARKRPLADGWAWSRKNSATDICPLVAITFAYWAGVRDGLQDYNVSDSIY